MGCKRIDLTGKKFGKLTAISYDHMRGTRSYWKCACECGGVRIVGADHLKRGEIVDCGCITRKKKPPLHVKHGMSNTRLYKIWALMKGRCYNEARKEYPRYGGRGIKVCEEWMTFGAFMRWAVNSGYSSTLTLDRINNDGDYTPSNCRWITKKEQAFNKSTNRYISYNGQRKTITQWASESNIPYYVLKKRIDVLHWDFGRAISEQPKKMKRKEVI